MDQIGLVSHHHHGSTPGHSPATALLSVYQQLVEHAEMGDWSALLQLDQSAAYDIVDHPLLLQKLKLIGMSPDTLSWLGSFLEGRSQVVEIEGF